MRTKSDHTSAEYNLVENFLLCPVDRTGNREQGSMVTWTLTTLFNDGCTVKPAFIGNQ